MKFSDFILNEATQRELMIDDQTLSKRLSELINSKIIWRLADKSNSAYDFKFFKDNINQIEALSDLYNGTQEEKGERIHFTIKTPSCVIRLQSSNAKSGASGNASKGHKLEGSLTQRINACVGIPVNEVQDDVVRRIMVEAGFSKLIAPCKMRGSENSKRGGDITMAGNYDIGETISDIDIFGLVGKKETKVPVSVKYGPMITYINRGKKDYFDTSDHKTRVLTKKPGINLFKALGLLDDEEAYNLYFDIFAKYKEFKEKGVKTGLQFKILDGFDSDKLSRIAMNAIGYGYILVHENPNNNFKVEKIDKNYLNQYKRVNKVTAKFKFGIKRVDFLVNYGQKKLRIVLRSKQGGVEPSHILVDWVPDNYNFKGND